MKIFCVLFAFLSVNGAPIELYNVANSTRSAAIVFPGVTSSPLKLPSRISANKFVPFTKAIRAIHYGATRILELTRGDAQENWMVSPISLTAMLGQLMLGSKGYFREILGDILNPVNNGSKALPGLDVHKELGTLLQLLQDEDVWSEYLLYMTSALFIQPDIALKLSYKHALSDIYNVNVIRTDFSKSPEISMDKINSWVKEATFGRMQDVLKSPVSPSTAALYLSTVYFRGSWKQPFDPSLTRPGFFSINETQKVPVEYMSGELEVKYLEDDECHCKMIGIPYQGSSIFLYIFLPDAAGSPSRLLDMASDLTPDRMADLIAASQLHNVTVTLPKVKLTTTISLRKPMALALANRKPTARDGNSIRVPKDLSSEENLPEMISSIFQPNPLPLKIEGDDKKFASFNMGSASDDYRFKIDDIVHKVQLEMNESGVEAVAVTSTLVNYMGGTLFRVDRPFLFMIRHEYTGVQLFWGTISNPELLK